MKTQFSRPRRFAVALVALVCASILFRSQIAQALVIRGDDYVYRGDRAQALERYRRAMVIAPSSEVAVDRYVFINLQLQTRASLESALATATQYLAAHPDDTTLLADRALCYLHLRRYASAAADFAHVARVSHSRQDAVFAHLAARAAHR